MGEARLFHNHCCFLGVFGNWYDGRVIAIGVGCKAGLLTGRYVLIYNRNALFDRETIEEASSRFSWAGTVQLHVYYLISKRTTHQHSYIKTNKPLRETLHGPVNAHTIGSNTTKDEVVLLIHPQHGSRFLVATLTRNIPNLVLMIYSLEHLNRHIQAL